MGGSRGGAGRAATAILWVVSGFYAYGAAVHVLNMASLTGFDWPTAPRRWQALDVVYLGLDVAVVAGLVRRRTYAVAAFYAAAVSQIVLYTALRGWVLDVPEAFAVSPAQRSYLDVLVGFHVVTLAGVTWALRAGTGAAAERPACP